MMLTASIMADVFGGLARFDRCLLDAALQLGGALVVGQIHLAVQQRQIRVVPSSLTTRLNSVPRMAPEAEGVWNCVSWGLSRLKK